MHDLGWEEGELSQTQEAKELGNGNEGEEKCKLNKIGFLCVCVCVWCLCGQSKSPYSGVLCTKGALTSPLSLMRHLSCLFKPFITLWLLEEQHATGWCIYHPAKARSG